MSTLRHRAIEPPDGDVRTAGPTARDVLAQWVTACDYRQVPTEVKAAARKALLNTLCTAVGGADIDSTTRALRYAAAQHRDGECTVLVRGPRLAAAGAVFVNGVMTNALGQEETHVASSTHPAQTTVPVVLAIGEHLNRSGADVLEALIAGMEVTAAIGCMQLTPAIKLDRCHSPAVFGTIGATAAAAKLAGLDEARTSHALGLATSFAAGLSEGSRAGTGEYHYLKGLLASHAILAVEMAADGAVAAPLAFEGDGGFYHTFAGVPAQDLAAFDVAGDLRALLERRWSIPDFVYKPYPANFFNLPFVDAARKLRCNRGVEADEIRRVRLRISEYAANSGGILRPPFTHRGNALASTSFCVAAMLARGHLLPADTFDIDASDIVGMCERIQVEVASAPDAIGLEVTTASGTVSIDLADKLLEYQLDEPEVRAIARAAAAAVLPGEQVDRLLSCLDELEAADSLEAVLRAAEQPTRESVNHHREERPR